MADRLLDYPQHMLAYLRWFILEREFIADSKVLANVLQGFEHFLYAAVRSAVGLFHHSIQCMRIFLEEGIRSLRSGRHKELSVVG